MVYSFLERIDRMRIFRLSFIATISILETQRLPQRETISKAHEWRIGK